MSALHRHLHHDPMNETQIPHQAPPPGPPPPPPRVLRRRDGPLGGVAAGLAHYLGVDAVLVRVGFVLLALLGGGGVVLYIAAWLLVPTAADDPSDRPVALRSDGVPALLGALALAWGAWVLIGPFDRGAGVLIPALLIGLGVWLLNQRPAPSPGHPQPPTARPADPPVPPGSWEASTPATRDQDPTARSGPAADDDPTATGPAAPVEDGTGAADEAWGQDTAEVPVTDRGPAGPGGAPPPPPPGTTSPWAVPYGPHEDPRPPAPGVPITSITLAVLALTIGFLLVLHAAGVITLTVVAVAGASLAIIGAGLVASAFLGRARGLLALGLLAAATLAVAPAADLALGGGVGDRVVTVDAVDGVEDRYELGVGNLVVDLRAVDPSDLERRVEVSVGIGNVEVIVPDGIRVEATARSDAGNLLVFGRGREGMGASLRVVDGPESTPVLELDARVRVGAVEVRRG
jgi:phage shock protein PspC (stress-responsive transcriptional regulator)